MEAGEDDQMDCSFAAFLPHIRPHDITTSYFIFYYGIKAASMTAQDLRCEIDIDNDTFWTDTKHWTLLGPPFYFNSRQHFEKYTEGEIHMKDSGGHERTDFWLMTDTHILQIRHQCWDFPCFLRAYWLFLRASLRFWLEARGTQREEHRQLDITRPSRGLRIRMK